MIRMVFLSPLRNIRIKVALFGLLLIASTTFVSYGITIHIMNQRIAAEVVKRAESLSRSLASTAGYSLISQDILSLDNMAYRIKSANQDIEYIAVLDTDHTALVHSDLAHTGKPFPIAQGAPLRQDKNSGSITEIAGPSMSLYEVTSPITFSGKILGTIVLGINKSVLLEAQREAREKIVWIFSLLLIAGVAGSIFLASFLTKPIEELSAGVEDLKMGNEGRLLRVFSRDELGRLTESFNEMTALITTQRNKLTKYASDLEEAYVSTVRVLAAAIDARDSYTHGHSTRVARMAIELGREIGLPPAELEELEISCLFHDVGKIKLPDSILLKRGKLSEQEQLEMRKHTEYGTEILSKAPSLVRYVAAARHHHEWHDGSGYPDGLAGDMIPLYAAIITLADVYDALTSERPYRSAMAEDAAERHIAGLSGKQFRPELAERFIEIVAKNKWAVR